MYFIRMYTQYLLKKCLLGESIAVFSNVQRTSKTSGYSVYTAVVACSALKHWNIFLAKESSYV